MPRAAAHRNRRKPRRSARCALAEVRATSGHRLPRRRPAAELASGASCCSESSSGRGSDYDRRRPCRRRSNARLALVLRVRPRPTIGRRARARPEADSSATAGARDASPTTYRGVGCRPRATAWSACANACALLAAALAFGGPSARRPNQRSRSRSPRWAAVRSRPGAGAFDPRALLAEDPGRWCAARRPVGAGCRWETTSACSAPRPDGERRAGANCSASSPDRRAGH